MEGFDRVTLGLTAILIIILLIAYAVNTYIPPECAEYLNVPIADVPARCFEYFN